VALEDLKISPEVDWDIVERCLGGT
jgi:hypothetical protein